MAIEAVGREQVYDIEVEGTHNFVANGILAHDTYLSSTATSASVKGVEVAQSGAISGTGYAGYFAKTGASTTNVGLYATASGATNNYAAIFDAGNVGIGTTSPLYPLHVVGSLFAGTALSEPANGGTTGVTGDKFIAYQAAGYRVAYTAPR